jgi:hypothetical protein
LFKAKKCHSSVFSFGSSKKTVIRQGSCITFVLKHQFSTMEKEQKRITFWATIFIGLGTLLLFKNFGLFNLNFPKKLFGWQLIPLVIGINACFRGDFRKAYIAIGIAVLFYIPVFLPYNFAQTYQKLWPLLLVGAGVLMYNKGRNNSFR